MKVIFYILFSLYKQSSILSIYSYEVIFLCAFALFVFDFFGHFSQSFSRRPVCSVLCELLRLEDATCQIHCLDVLSLLCS